MPVKIAVVDDHNLIAEGIASMLRYSSDIEVTGAFSDGTSLLDAIQIAMPDIVLLDIQMPGMQGDELAERLRLHYPGLKIIAFTSFDTMFHIKRMMKHNIEGYLLKNIRREQLAEAITTVYNGGTYLDVTVRKMLDDDLLLQKRQKALGALLTKREKEILPFIVKNYTCSEISEMLFISKRTVEHHRESIFSKLEVRKVSALAEKAAQLGLI